MKVIGIDPGTATVGFSVVEGTKQNPVILEYGILQTSPKDKMEKRLLEIGNDLEFLLQKYQPKTAVVEDLFFFKNAKTVISVAQARGVILYILTKYNVEIVSLTPLQVKLGTCGYGKADKKQMQTMVQKIFKLDQLPKPDDAADSLAMAWLGLK